MGNPQGIPHGDSPKGLGLGLGLGIGGFKNAFGDLVGGVKGSIFPQGPNFDSMKDEEYFASLK